jgi:ATP-dependent Lon protease
VIVLDEIDKLGRDNRGDPASALLEVLDPEQNNTFMDHYLDVPFDLSHVMFIATANRRDTIPGPLLDRMEVIEIPGYTRDEKKAIARSFLIPKQLSEHGLTPDRLDFGEESIDFMVDHYTREAGVRLLEQRVAAVCRHVAVRLAKGEEVYVMADPKQITDVLGPAPHEKGSVERQPAVGVAAGLAWSPAGGDLMFIESMRMPGKGTVQLTGQMGDVMKESAAAAFTYLRARARTLGLDPDFLSKIDVHVHLPQGAVPKDGPSAGIAILVSLASMLTGIKVRHDVALTGEVTLRGNVLRVGGIKDKCLAAHRAGVKHVVMPKQNEPDLDEVPKEVRDALTIHLVTRIEEVLPIALESMPLVESPGASASI